MVFAQLTKSEIKSTYIHLFKNLSILFKPNWFPSIRRRSYYVK